MRKALYTFVCSLLTTILYSQTIQPAGPINICQGSNVVLSATNPPAGASFQWKKDGVVIGGAKSDSYTVTTSGNYTVVVADTLVYGPVKVTVNDYPKAGFNFSPKGSCSNVPVFFTNTASGTGLTYSWSFDDPKSSQNTSSAINPNHVFVGVPGNNTQSFSVSLVADHAGCKDTATQTVTTTQIPGVQLGGTGSTTYNGLPYFTQCTSLPSDFTFTNQSTTKPTNTTYTIKWGDLSPDFTTSSFTSVNHTYALGTYKIQFIVVGQNGCRDTGNYNVFVGNNPAVGLNNPGNTFICSQSSLTFPISGTTKNPPGTVYTVSFNDGSDAVFYNHPPPADVTHLFDKGSCGIFSPGFPNSFQATIQASNPCGTSAASVVPIYVSEKTKAVIGFSPDTIICVTTSLTLTNLSGNGFGVDAFGACREGKGVWSMSPATGWTKTGGDFGDDFGFADPSLWQNGTTSVTFSFTQPGTYFAKLKTAATQACGGEEVVLKICVNPAPVADFSVSANEGCLPLAVKTTNKSNTPLCSSNTYEWSVSYSNASGCDPNTQPGYIYTNSTTSTSENPQFEFTSPGIYKLTLITKNSRGLCTSSPFSQTIVVKSKPNVTLPTINAICQNETVQPSATINNCYATEAATYSWSFEGGIPATSTAANPGKIQYLSAGVSTIKLDVTNECGTTTVTKTVTVNPIPDISGIKNLVVCEGAAVGPINFASSLAGTTFQWTNSRPAIGLPASGFGSSIPSFIAKSNTAVALTATITVTATANGCSKDSSFTITVNPKPAPPAVVDESFCQNSVTVPLTATETAGHRLLWYTGATGGTGSAAAPFPTTTNVGSTAYYVSQIDTITGCESNRVALTVTIKPIPVIAAKANNPSSCASATGSIVLSGLTAGSFYAIGFSRNGVPAAVINQTAASNGKLTILGLTAGIYSDITVTLDGCKSAAIGPITLTDPSSPEKPTVGAVSPVCSGYALNLTASTVPNAQYSWTGPAGFISSTQNPSIPAATVAMTGTYFVTVTVAGCTSPPASVDAVVNLTPAKPTVGSNSPLCSDSTIVLTALSATSGVSYTWSGPDGYASAVQNPTITNATIANAGTYSVIAILGSCVSPTSFTNVVVNPTPKITNAGFKSPTACGANDGTITLEGIAPGSYTLSYEKDGVPVTLPNQTAGASGIMVLNNLSSGTYSKIKLTANGCSSTEKGPFELKDPNPPAAPVASSNSPVCQGSTIQLTATSSTPGTSFDWVGPAGFTANLASPFIANADTKNAGIYTVRATINGCTVSATTTVVINDKPAKPAVTSPIVYCQNETALPLTATGSNLTWYTKADTSDASATAPTPSTLNDRELTFFVLQTNSLSCKSDTASITVLVHPSIKNDSIEKDQTLCEGGIAATLVSKTTISGGDGTYKYQWQALPASKTIWTDIPGANAETYSPGSQGETTKYRRIVSSSTCSDTSNVVTITVQGTLTNVAIQESQVICAGTKPLTLTGNTPVGGSGSYDYVWESSPDGSSWTTIKDSIRKDFSPPALTTTLYYHRGVKSGECFVFSNAVKITVNPVPQLNPVSDVVVCNGATTPAVPFSATPSAGTTFNWSAGNPPIGLPPNGSGSIAPFVASNTLLPKRPAIAAISVTPVYTALGVSCSGTPGSFSIVVLPTVTLTPIPNLVKCTGVTVAAYTPVADTVATANAGLSYSWTVTGSGIDLQNGSGNNIPEYSTSNTGTTDLTATITVTPQYTYAGKTCEGTPMSYTVTVKPSTAPAAAGPDVVLCADSVYTMKAVAVTGTTGVWSQASGPAATIVTPASPVSVVKNLQPGNLYRFVWTQTGFADCPPTTDTVVIDNKAALQNKIDTATQMICAGQTVVVKGFAPTGGSVGYAYQWQQSTDGIKFNDIAGETGQNVTLTLTNSVYLRRYVTSLPCANYSDTVHIIVQAAISNNSISADAAICTGTPAPLINGSAPTGGNNVYEYSWLQSTNAGLTWDTIPGATAANFAPGILTKTTQYRRTVSTTLCSGPFGSVSNTVTITVNPDAKATFLPTDTLQCPPFSVTPAVINLQPNAANGSYQWYADGVLIGSNPTFPGYVITKEADSVKITLKVFSAFGCKSDSLSQVFHTYLLPHPAFMLSDTVGCGPLTVQATNTTANLAQFSYFWDFGNGQTANTPQPPAVSFAPNPESGDTTYLVTLKVFSVCDTLTVMRSVRVKAAPQALFTPTKTTGCSPLKVVFKNTSRGYNNTYTWDFGDGTVFSTTSAANVEHEFNAGVVTTFYVKLKAVNECGRDSIRYAIVVAPNSIKLNVAVNGPEHFGCTPHTVAFINNSRGASTFQWVFGDGDVLSTTKNIDTVYHTYLKASSYTVNLRAFNTCSDTATVETITVYPKPTAAFAVDNNTVCIGDSIRFKNLSDSATSYFWQFGDGNTSTLVQPTHKYAAEGLYTVKLTIYRNNPSGSICSDSTTQQVQVSSVLAGSFTASDTLSKCAPLTVTFLNKNRPSVLASWEFGDGQTATGDSVVHTFKTFGIYPVKLVVTVPGGCTYVVTKTITVSGPGGELKYNGGYVCLPGTVRLEAAAKNTDSYQWNFDDGTPLQTTTQNFVYHNYANPGFYLPSVILLNKAGCAFPIKGTDTIKVDKLNAGFATAQQILCGSTTVSFTDTSTAFYGKAQVTWNFGDGTTGSGPAVSHSYNLSGTYPVEMIMVGKSGCADTVRRQLSIVVNSKPAVSITPIPKGCTGKPITFNSNVQSADAINIRKWTITPGNITASGTSFTYQFLSPGNYAVQFIAGTAAGCYDTTSTTIEINPGPQLSVSANATICAGTAVTLSASGAETYQWSPARGLSCDACAKTLATPTVTTPYVVEGKNSFGCVDYDTVVVTVIQPIQLKISGNDSICIGQSTDLNVSGGTIYNWSPAEGLSNTTLSNPIASPTVTTTYRVVGYDGFNCFTDTAFVTVAVGQYPTVDLGPDLTLAAGTQQQLASTVTNGPIRDWLWSPATNLSCNNCALPTAEVKKAISYAVKVTTAYGCSASDTISIKVFCESSQVFIPNAFTPDNDGVNDVLMVRARGVVSVKYFRVFNRWGELVFEQSNFVPNNPLYGWDGRVKGKPTGPDVFVYTCEAMCENGTLFTYKGNVTLIK